MSFLFKFFAFIAFLYMASFSALAQPNAKWYFGEYAGLDFATNPPTILNNGKLFTAEGSATISNDAGQLLFYTDGVIVYDKNHNVMPNGTGLMGNTSSAQSAVVVPKPGTFNATLGRSDIYYIITTDAASSILGGSGYGIRYTELNMTLNGGLGEINPLVKNVHLFGDVTLESVAIVPHSNGCDYWIVIHDHAVNTFLVYQVDANGINHTPNLSTIGPLLFAWSGTIKASHDGKMISVANHCTPTGGLFLFGFDNATGTITSLIFSDNSVMFYGSEFSPDNTKLYGTCETNEFYQYNLDPADGATFLPSKTTVGTSPYVISSIQIAPNGKIYTSLNTAKALGVINNPDNPGMACGFVDQGQSIAGTNLNGNQMVCKWGLPTFASSFSSSSSNTIDVDSTEACEGTACCFTLNDPTYANSTYWEVFEVNATTPFHSVTAPDFCYTLAPGDYVILAIIQRPCSVDTIQLAITTGFNPVTPVISGNLAGCPTVTLNAGNYASYLWSNGATTQTTQVSVADNPITVTVTTALGCTYTSAPVIVTDSLISNDTLVIHEGDSVLIHGNYHSTTDLYSQYYQSVAGCDSLSNVYLIVNLFCPDIFVPSIFSPNGDGQNDNLCVLGGCIAKMDFSVYNRWGEQVFRATSPGECWDGNFKGQQAESGAYVYQLSASQKNGVIIKQAGNVSIIR